nr:putative E3 ubiquitin-protein ligase XBAT31 [Ipomoea trifida]
MGQELSCRPREEQGLFSAVQGGDVEMVEAVLQRDPSLVRRATVYDRHSALHIAAANGHIQIVTVLLNRSINPDLLNRHKQTPLMLAAMYGKISCVQKLIEAGANILVFDSLHGRTCLHYAAYYGHSDCLKAILSAARTSHVAVSCYLYRISRGYARFVNVRDGKGATPLHLASRQRQPECVHMLLDNGALVCASTSGYGFPGSSPLHLAARGGSLDCIRELLAWGADRLQKDVSGRIPYTVALRYHHGACAALLNPSSAEPLVWPSPLKFISELNKEAKALLEQALMEANKEREKNILKGTSNALPPPHFEAGSDGKIPEVGDTEVCCICFDQLCSIEVRDCGHQMCAHCVLALCCHNKPDPKTTVAAVPLCPFCRSSIAQLSAIEVKGGDNEQDAYSKTTMKARRSRNMNEGSSSFKGLSSGVGSLGRIGGCGLGKIAAENQWIDKPSSLDS